MTRRAAARLIALSPVFVGRPAARPAQDESAPNRAGSDWREFDPARIDAPLVDQRGGEAPFAARVADRAFVVGFIFTTCPVVCPRITASMARLRKALAGRNGVTMLSVSVDPERDKPAVLAAFARTFSADWTFLTGRPDHVAAALRGLGAFSPDPVLHTTQLLVGSARAKRATWINSAAPLDILVRTVEDACAL